MYQEMILQSCSYPWRELSDPALFSVALICRFDLHKTKKSQKSRNNLMFCLIFNFKPD